MAYAFDLCLLISAPLSSDWYFFVFGLLNWPYFLQSLPLHESAKVSKPFHFFWGKHHGLPSYRSRITCWMGLWILQLKKGPQALQGNIEWNDIPDIPDMLLVGNCLPYLPNTSKKVMVMGWLHQLHRECGWHTDEWFQDKSQMEWFNWWLLANIDGLLQAKHLKKLGNIQCICLEKVNHKLN